MIALALGLFLLMQSAQSGPSQTVEIFGPDTVVIDGKAVRLWGTTPFAADQKCSEASSRSGTCDDLAHELLTKWIEDGRASIELLTAQNHPEFAQIQWVRCNVVETSNEADQVGRCEILNPSCYGVVCEEVWYDLGEDLIASGAVTQNRRQTSGTYDDAEDAARAGELGGWATLVVN